MSINYPREYLDLNKKIANLWLLYNWTDQIINNHKLSNIEATFDDIFLLYFVLY